MPLPPPLTPPNIKPLHLYRQLLREVSYLPPAFSGAIRTIISHRFRLDRTKKNLIIKDRLSRGRSALRRLRDANNGHAASMLGLVVRGFAKSGASRRSLVSKLSAKDAPSDSAALAKALAKPHHDQDGSASSPPITKNPKYGWIDRLDKNKLQQFVTSQKLQEEVVGKFTLQGFSGIKGPNKGARVPTLNEWGKPTPENVVRANQAKAWKKTLEKLLPPLTRWQWELLRDLANGAQETAKWKVPARRPKAKPLSGPAEQSEWDWKAYAMEPTVAIEGHSRLRQSRLSIQPDDSNPFSIRKRLSPTRSDRWFRRVYETMWRNSAIMEQDPQTLRYEITWGGQANKYSKPTQRQVEFLNSAQPLPEPNKKKT